MAMQIKDNSLEALKASAGDKPYVIDFSATWCGPCRMISPMVDEMAAKYDGQVAIAKCDVDDNSDLAAEFSIRNIPTLIFIKNGEIVDRTVGALTKPELEAKIKALI